MAHDVFGASQRSPAHAWLSAALLFETLSLYALLVGLIVWAVRADAGPYVLGPLTVAAGFWLDRMITVGHEAAHRKLFPEHPLLNDLCGAVVLAPLLVPLVVYRQIHGFHHGHNRRAPRIATLDVVVLPPGPGPRRVLAWLVGWIAWILGVFCGGFYLHGLVSIVLFLLLPTALARRISPAFKHWRLRQRLRAWLELGLGVAFHLALARALGLHLWLHACALPTLAFAWIYTLFVYIYHYRAPIGGDVRHNARSLARNPLLSWVLLDFNEHATHHADPRLPWYLLARRRVAVAPAPGEPRTILAAVLYQLRGPVFVEQEARE
ncbi:MAG TPA: fatty acid desaturase [Nannocystis sp.]